MKRLLIAVVIAGLAWSGWWFYAAHRQKAAIEAWFDARRTDGWTAQYANLEVRGFPNRLDATFTDLAMTTPDGSTVWRAPLFQILMLSYTSEHAILVWPHSQTLEINGTQWFVESESMLASVILVGGEAQTITRANFEADVLNLTSDEGSAAMSALNLALMEAGPDVYRLAASADGYAPGGTLPADLPLPSSLHELRADLTIAVDAPLNLAAWKTSLPRPTRIDLHLAEAIWGELQLHLAGAADVTASGYLDGQMAVRAVNWRSILRLASTSGTLPQDIAAMLEQALDLAANMSGNKDTLDLSIDFKHGRTWLGMIPLGPAPRLP